MARLKIRLRGQLISELPLAEDKVYLAGRKDGADIFLQGDKGISREHFRVFFENGAWNLESLSRFGEIDVAGEKAARAVLEHGLTFRVASYEFEFLMTSGDAAGAMTLETSAQSIHTSGSAQSMTGGLPAISNRAGGSAAEAIDEDFSEKTVVGVAPSVPYIKILDAQGETRELIRLEGGDSWLAGRDSSCNIHIRDQRVSRRQFEIRKNNSQYLIVDLGSVNGTLVNGNPISTTDLTPLKSGDAITVLENYLYFELHDPNFKSRLELVNLQPAPSDMALVPYGVGGALPQAMQMPGMQPPALWQDGTPMVYDPNAAQPPAAAPAPAGPMTLKDRLRNYDYKKNRVKLIIGAVAILGLLFALSNRDDEGPKNIQPMIQDPLSKLTAEQKKLVKDTLQLAKSYYMQGKFEFAKSELVKMTELVPEFEDSRELMKLTEEAIYVQQAKRKQEEMEKNQKEQEEKIHLRAAECRKLVKPDTTRDQMEKCLADVMVFNPAHPLFEELFGQIDKFQADKAALMAQEASYKADVDKLKALYAKAKSIDKAGKPLSAMLAYQTVIGAKHQDPGNLKVAAKNRISELKDVVNSKTANLQKDVERFVHDGKLKEAIYALRRAKMVDPNNPMLDEKIEYHRQKLQEDMMRVYQEGILDESFGNIDGDENHPGAKLKWKKILKEDIQDGEYYKKAYLKLKKYGSPL